MNFLFSFNFFKNAQKLQKGSTFSRKNKKLYIDTTILQLEQLLVFVFVAEVQYSASSNIINKSNISNLSLCDNSLTLNMSLKKKWVF